MELLFRIELEKFDTLAKFLSDNIEIFKKNHIIFDDKLNPKIFKMSEAFSSFSLEDKIEIASGTYKRYCNETYETFIFFLKGIIVNGDKSSSLYLKIKHALETSDFVTICKILMFMKPNEVQFVCNTIGIEFSELKIKCRAFLNLWKPWTENFDL